MTIKRHKTITKTRKTTTDTKDHKETQNDNKKLLKNYNVCMSYCYGGEMYEPPTCICPETPWSYIRPWMQGWSAVGRETVNTWSSFFSPYGTTDCRVWPRQDGVNHPSPYPSIPSKQPWI